MNLAGLQIEVEEWSNVNAPDTTPSTCLAHIREEVRELGIEVARLGDGRLCNVSDEAADIVILLAHLAKVADFDLQAAVDRKWHIVKQRRYVKDEHGVYHHVSPERVNSFREMLVALSLYKGDELFAKRRDYEVVLGMAVRLGLPEPTHDESVIAYIERTKDITFK
jgi:NTP pyrophosphatase (non-canonical NTP hydrolase)